jgi:flagellar basal-body rod modification protein FlgD
MNPMDGHQMAADLAQFSGLEQLVNINDTLAAQKDQFTSVQSAINNNVALGTIGKHVTAADDHVLLAVDPKTGALSGRVTADIAAGGAARLSLVDASGRIVGTRSLGSVSTGELQQFDVGSAAAGLSPGVYTVRVEVADGKGGWVPQQTYYTGVVDGVSYASTGAVLTSGTITLPIGSVRKIAG